MDKQLCTIVVTDYNQETKFSWHNVPEDRITGLIDGHFIFQSYDGARIFYKVAFGELVLIINQKGFEQVENEDSTPQGVLH